jgi:hypothetical protein
MTIDVLGRRYKVKVAKFTKDLHGDCDNDKAVIRLNRRYPDTLSEALVHETLHAILHQSGVRFLLDSTDGLEEAIVRAIEHGLFTANLIREDLADEMEAYHGLADDTSGGSPEDTGPVCQGQEIHG